MDYMNIILTGATNPNTIQFFTDYIIREYKKAANEGLSKDEFFSGCRMVVGWLFDELERVYDYSLTKLPYCDNPESLDKWSCGIDLQRVSNGTHTGTMTGDGVYLILKSVDDAEKLAPATVTTSPGNTDLTFLDYLNAKPAEAMKLANKIKSILPVGQKDKGKAAAAVYWVLHEATKIDTDQHTVVFKVMKEYFGDIGDRSGFSKWFMFNPKDSKLTCKIKEPDLNIWKRKIIDEI